MFLYSHSLNENERKQTSFTWEVTNDSPFNELVVSWNALRPLNGQYRIYISLLINNNWSYWLPYAEWGSEGQRSFSCSDENISIFQDTMILTNDIYAKGWRVKIEAPCSLKDFHSIYASSPSLATDRSSNFEKFICLGIPGLSQLNIKDPRNNRICSPTSATAVVHFLSNNAVHPLDFAEKVWDKTFDIYGNWSFAVAQAYASLGNDWEVKVCFLKSFEDVYQLLLQGYPVITSVKGSLPGSYKNYSEGHLLVIRGYDPEKSRVLCMDPAFPTDTETLVSYPLASYLSCWHLRKKIAYVFNRRSC